jgi:hypothetical protein
VPVKNLHEYTDIGRHLRLVRDPHAARQIAAGAAGAAVALVILLGIAAARRRSRRCLIASDNRAG